MRLVLRSAATPPAARDAEPDRHVLRPVRHQQADDVAPADALPERPAGIAVRVLGELAIAQALAVRQQRRPIAVAHGQFVDDMGKQARRVLRDVRRHLEGAHDARDEGGVILQAIKELHARTLPVKGADPEADTSIRQLAQRGKRPDYRPPNGTSGLSMSAARSGWSGAAGPRKASNRSLTARASMSRMMNTSRVRWSASGQPLERRRRMEDVLHAVDHDRLVRRLGELHDALHAQQVRPVHRAHQVEEHLEGRDRNRRVGRQREGADAVVVAVHVVMVVMVIVVPPRRLPRRASASRRGSCVRDRRGRSRAGAAASPRRRRRRAPAPPD